MILQIFGWIVFVFLGLYLLAAGLVWAYVGSAFSGKFQWGFLLIAALGIAVLVTAYLQAPFSITFGSQQ